MEKHKKLLVFQIVNVEMRQMARKIRSYYSQNQTPLNKTLVGLDGGVKHTNLATN